MLILLLILVQRWVELPWWFIWGLITLWVVKDTILFPFTWRAYDWDRSSDVNTMVGERAIADERLAPWGYVQIHGELWRAKVIGANPPVEKGEEVRIKEIRGLTLLVQPEAEESGEGNRINDSSVHCP